MEATSIVLSRLSIYFSLGRRTKNIYKTSDMSTQNYLAFGARLASSTSGWDNQEYGATPRSSAIFLGD
jgi:hypothetical protein